MNRNNKNDDRKISEKKPLTKKKYGRSSNLKKDFNTGSHSPSSLRNVGPGYDDTGMGNESKTPGKES